jgi:uncharacterized phage infection (PIP) family protein YhgE
MGTEAFWVPALMTAVSTGASYVNQQNANSRAQNTEVQDIANQQQLREQGNSQVKQQTQNIASSTPQQLANKETGDFVKSLRQNIGGKAAGGPTNFGAPVSSLGSTPGANSRFASDTAAANKQTQQYGQTNAAEMGAVDSAVRQRQNEGLQMQTLGTNLNQLNAQSQMTGFVDQLRAKAASQPNPYASLFSSALGGAANSASKNGWFTKDGPGSTGYGPADALG